MRYTVRPISDRTEFTGKHQRSQFDSSWTSTLQLLAREIVHLDGRNIVLEVDVPERGIRNDGMIRADARPATPGVRVAFESKHGPLTYATDRFAHWQDNVRALALGLEALRKVDRYGISKRGQQYTGWKALPSSGVAEPATPVMDVDLAWSTIGSYQDLPIRHFRATHTPDELRRAYRRARAANHPDRHGGDQALWDQVEQAAKVLGVLS